MGKHTTQNTTLALLAPARAMGHAVLMLLTVIAYLAIALSMDVQDAQAEDYGDQSGVSLAPGVMAPPSEAGSDVPYAGSQPSGTAMWWNSDGTWGGWIDGDDVVLGMYAPGLSGDVTIPAQFQATIYPDDRDPQPYVKTVSVTTIAGEAFLDNESITSVDIPWTVTRMGIGVFRGCTALEAVSFNGEELAAIPKDCFKDCSSLIEFTIPSSVRVVGTSAFHGCSSLKKATFQSPASVETIGVSAFQDCLSLSEIAIPTSVRNILAQAFKGCKSLVHAYFINADLSNLNFINTEAFEGCSALKEIELPFALPGNGSGDYSAIGPRVFDGCSALEKVGLRNIPRPNGGLPSQVKPFSDCKNLKFVIIDVNNFSEMSGSDLGLPKNATYLLVDKVGSGSTASLEIWKIYTDSRSGIDTEAGSVDLVIPAKFITYDFTAIKADAACERIETIAQGTQIVYPQTGLKSLSFESGSKVTSIGAYAFANCDHLESVTLPASITSIGDKRSDDSTGTVGWTFYGCDALSSVNLEDTQIPIVEAGLFSGCKSLDDITIPNGVTQIKEKAFEGCTSLTHVYIPDSVTQIDTYAFKDAGAKSGTEFRMPDSDQPMVLGDYFFRHVGHFDKTTFRVTCGSWFEDQVLGSSYELIDKAVYDAVDITLPEDDPTNTTVKIATKASNLTYNTEPKKPVFDTDPDNSNRWFHKPMLLDEDFEIDYSKSECTNAGNGYVTIVGIGPKFTGERVIPLHIEQADIAGKLKFNTLDVPNGGCYWDNKKWEPTATVKYEALTSIQSGIGDYVLTDDDCTITYGANADAGDQSGSVIVKGKGNFKGEDTLHFPIRTRDIATEATIEPIPDQHYTGSALTPKPHLSVKDRNGADLELDWREGGDYSIDSYASNVEIGTGYVYLKGNGNVTGSAYTTFNIVSLDLDDEDVEVEYVDDQTYTGDEITPELTVTYKDDDLVEGEAYNVSWSNNVNVGTATATIMGIEPKAKGKKIITFDIVPAEVTVKANDTRKTYGEEGNGSQGLSASVAGVVDDYAVVYSLSREAGEDAGTYAITPTGETEQGNYIVSFKPGEFTIEPADISSATIAALPNVTYDGEAFTPATTVTWGNDNRTLEVGTDYDVEYVDNTDKGTATVTITGKGNFKNSKGTTFEIAPLDISKTESECMVHVPLQICEDAASFDPKPSYATVAGRGGKTLTLVEGEDYTVEDSAYVDENHGTVTIAGKGNYCGSKTAQVTIIGDGNLETRGFIGKIPDQTYTGAEINPTPVVELDYVEGLLRRGVDYDLVYVNNVNVTRDANGEVIDGAKVTAVGKGKPNVYGEKSKMFRIVPADIGDAEVSLEDQPYSGANFEPKPTVTWHGQNLTENVDYVIAGYTGLGSVGEATVTITGMGNFKNTATGTFNVVKRLVTVKPANLEKTFGDADPLLTATVEDIVTGETVEYSLSREAGENVGTYAISSSGETDQGNYTVSFDSGELAIEPASIKQATITGVSDTVYDGYPHIPEPVVTWNEQTLLKDTDYYVEYEENRHAGTGRVSVHGKGNFKDKADVDFTISPFDISKPESECEAHVPAQLYADGAPLEPRPTIVTALISREDPLRLEDGADYDVTGWHDNTGDYYGFVTIKGKGDYCGSLDVRFTVIPNGNLGEYGYVSDIPDQEYTGEEIDPNPTVYVSNVNRPLKRGLDYQIEYVDNVNAGHLEDGQLTRAQATITGLGNSNIHGSFTTSFLITPADIADAEVDVDDQAYDGTTHTPKPTVTWNGKTLTENTDYEIAGYTGNTQAGPAEVTLTGKGNFKGTTLGSFEVEQRKLIVTAGSATRDYNGDPLTVDALEGEGLADGDSITSVTIVGSQTDVGGRANVPKDAVIVNGAGEDVTDSYDISYKNGYLEVTPITAEVNVTVTGHADTIVYDGAEHEVAGYNVTADNELYLAAFTRYSGDASVKATDVGIHAMELSKEGFSNATRNFSDVSFEVADGSLTIEAADLADTARFAIDPIDDEVYDGKAKRPEAVVHDAATGGVLVEGTDYTLTYRDNVNVGTATVTIMGKGNYQGEREVTFRILERVITYTLVSGPSGPVKQGTGAVVELQFKRSFDDETTLDHFESVLLNGKTLPRSVYDTRKGSVIITLKSDYIDTLEPGDQTLTAMFDDGQGTATFTLAAPDKKPNSSDTKPSPSSGGKSSATGDNLLGVAIAIVVIALGAGCIIAFARRRMKERGEMC